MEQNYVQFLSIIIIIICFYFYLFFLQKYWSNTYCKTHIQTKKKNWQFDILFLNMTVGTPGIMQASGVRNFQLI